MKTKPSFIGRLLFLIWCGLVPALSFAQQIPKSLTAANGTFIGFWEYKPTNYTTTKKYPLIIFLHGIGERGDGTTQLSYVLANAIPRYIANGNTMTFTYNGVTETFLVLSPQLRSDYWSWPSFYADEMIKYAKQNLSIDTNRIYLTGLSLGGGGTWKYATESYANAKGLAAIATVCGTCDWSNMCSTIAAANLPVWSFHAQDDGVVGYGCTTGAIANINACNPTVAPLMTIYPNGNHYIWDRAYDTTHNWQNPNVYEWFLSHSRSGAAVPSNIPPIARAGADQSITLPTNAVTVDGSTSSDPDGSVVAYNWTKIAGPTQYTIVNAGNASTVINNLTAGVYSFQLTVTDNRGAIGKDTVLINVTGSMPTPNQPPVALAGADQAITLPANNTYLFGSASYDPDGYITAWSWSQVAGPSTATITALSATNVNVSNLVQGVYKFRLLVTDNMGAVDDDTVNVSVSAPNVPPNANAGPDQSIQLPANSVTLNGSGSNDPDGTITSYSWSKIAGPAQYTITTASSANTTVTNLVAGTYSFRLLVTDNRGASDDDTVVITVTPAPPPPNIPPTANAGSDQSIQLPTNSVTLNGSASSDPDGTITNYAWTKIAGPAQFNITNGSSVSTTVTNLAAGSYSFRLVVTDNNGATGADTVIVNVAPAPPPPNIPPTANAGNDIFIQLPTANASLNGSASTDADGTIVSYAWSKIAGPAQYNIANSTNATTPVNNLVAGTYSFRLVVTDNNGATGDDTVLINVAPAPNMLPTANAGADQSIQLPANSVTLNGSASSDADGTITNYAWSYVSGPAQYNIATPNSVTTTVNNLLAGTYSFRLLVTDNNGATDDDTVLVTVSAAPPPPNIPPVARAGNDQSIQLPTNSVLLDGSASSDADGTITAYAWSKISGPAQYNISTANNAATNVTNLVAGTYSFRLVVTDNTGATDADTVVVTVTPAPPPPNIPPTANAGSDQSIQLPTNSVTLSGAASSDPDGTIVGYAWSKISGPAQFNITNGSNVTTGVNNLVAGTYSFRLVVTDNNGATDADTVIVNVAPAPPPPNIPPTANAGNDQSIQLPVNSVSLSGAASTDADGTIVSYAWSKISGPAQFNISNANSVNTNVNNLVAGTYAFRLIVTDNAGATGDDTVIVNVAAAPPPPNIPPVARAGNDQVLQLPANIAMLDGSASSDADGTITSFAWTMISGPSQYNITNAANATTSVTGLVQGVYAFRLVVTDNSGASAADTVLITVSSAPPPPNVPPVAKAGNDVSITLPANSVSLNGTASYDPDGTIITYAWNRISGPAGITITNATTATADVVGMTAGVYVFELTVTDNNGAAATDQVQVTVGARPNQSPIAWAGNDTTIAIPASAVKLNGLGSRDPDGNITAYQWRQISGPVSRIQTNAAAVTVVDKLIVGEYQFELTVTDDLGAIGKDTVHVSVVNNFRYEESLTIYPNPANVIAHVRCVSDSTGELVLRVLDLNGQFIMAMRAFKGQSYFEQDIMLSELKPGMYYLEAVIGDKKRMIRKFVKQ